MFLRHMTPGALRFCEDAMAKRMPVTPAAPSVCPKQACNKKRDKQQSIIALVAHHLSGEMYMCFSCAQEQLFFAEMKPCKAGANGTVVSRTRCNNGPKASTLSLHMTIKRCRNEHDAHYPCTAIIHQWLHAEQSKPKKMATTLFRVLHSTISKYDTLTDAIVILSLSRLLFLARAPARAPTSMGSPRGVPVPCTAIYAKSSFCRYPDLCAVSTNACRKVAYIF